MKIQPRLNKKWTIIYSLAVALLLVSTYILTLPLDTKLRFFCTMGNAHIAETPPTSNPGYYWTNPNTGTNLTVITIWEVIDGGTWLFYDNPENIFWIGVQTGPMKNAFYGPYQGSLWILTNTMDPLAAVGITLSVVLLIYPSLSRLWTKTTQQQPHEQIRNGA